MAYATAEAFEEHLGPDRHILVSDRDLDGSSDTSAVESALNAASSVADSYLSTLLPIAEPYPQSLVDAVFAIATYRLAGNNATEDERTRYMDAIEWLRDIAKGRAQLSSADAEVSTGGEPVLVDADDRQWSRSRSGRIF